MTIHEKLDILLGESPINSITIPRITFFGTYQGAASYFYFPTNAKKVTFNIDPTSNQNGGSAFSLKSSNGTIASNLIAAKQYTYELRENSFIEYGCGSSYTMTLTNIIIEF